MNSDSKNTSPKEIVGTPLVSRFINDIWVATIGKYKVFEADSEEELVEIANQAYTDWESIGKALAAQHDYFQTMIDSLVRRLETLENK